LKILERLDGQRVVLICEKIKDVPLKGKIVLEGDGEAITIDNCDMPISKECFSASKTTTIILPMEYTLLDIKSMNTVYLIN